MLLLSLALALSSLFVLSSCGEDTPPECTEHIDADDDGVCDNEGCSYIVSTTATYTLTIKDYFGNVPTGSFVLDITKNDGTTMKIRIKDGAASTVLPRAEHTFSVDTEGSYVYDESEAYWSADRRNVTLTLYSPVGNKHTLQVACTEHFDSTDDNDCKCDMCGITLSGSHKNENSDVDCICDVCKEIYSVFHNDADGDCVCNFCLNVYHTDKDNDYACDFCSTALVSIEPLVEGRRPADAYAVFTGATQLSASGSGISYYIFTPTVSGVYKFYVISESGATLGYYGAPHFVQKENTATIVNGAFSFNISDGAVNNDGISGTSQYVLGIKSKTEENVILVIERLSDPAVELPFTDIHADRGSVKYEDALNDALVDIDIRNAVTVVYNENDGFYHYGSIDGPIVVVKIKASGNSNLPDFSFPSFLTITETDRLCCYFYNDEGQVIRKENYNTLIEDYASLAGSRGIVPLNKTLADALKNMGEHKGWWKKSGNGANYIFGDANVNAESAWLFACAYLDSDRYGADKSPITIAPENEASYAARVSEGELVYIKVNAQSAVSYTLTLNVNEKVTVFVGSEMYFGDTTGQLTIDVKGTDIISISSTEDMVCSFTFLSK